MKQNHSTDWQKHFCEKAQKFGYSVKSCDYISANSFRARQKNILQWLFEKEPLGKTILDAGCGPGIFSADMAKTNQVIGMDFCMNMLKICSSQKLSPICANITQTPFRKDSFDTALGIEVFQYVENFKLCMEEMLRILKPNGTLCVSTLNSESVIRKIYKTFIPRKEREFSVKQISDAMRDFGFKNISFMLLFYPVGSYAVSPNPTLAQRRLASCFAVKGTKPL